MTPSEGHLNRIRLRREAAERRAAQARRRAGLARAQEAESTDPLSAARFASEALAHERAAELQLQAAESQREHELEAGA